MIADAERAIRSEAIDAALLDVNVRGELVYPLAAMLAERGIHTLGQARDAAQKTYYARVKY